MFCKVVYSRYSMNKMNNDLNKKLDVVIDKEIVQKFKKL